MTPTPRQKLINELRERAETMRPDDIDELAAVLPVDVAEAAKDFGYAVGMTTGDIEGLIKHNISVPYELQQYAQGKRTQKLEWWEATEEKW